LALDDVAAVARIPLEDVVAGAEVRRVVALVAVDEIVAIATKQVVGASATEDRVVAGPTVDRQLHHTRGQGGRRYGVITTLCTDHELIVGPLGSADGNRRWQADDGVGRA